MVIASVQLVGVAVEVDAMILGVEYALCGWSPMSERE